MTQSRIVLSVVFASLVSLFGAHSALALSPPWFLLQEETKATVGADRAVVVDDLKPISGGYNLDVHVSGHEKADALATLLTRQRDFGGTLVNTRVFHDNDSSPIVPIIFPTNPDQAAHLIDEALSGNRYYVQIDPGNGVYDLFVEFNPSVVQYFADNIGDAYKNNNEVAAAAFDEICDFTSISGIHVGVSTSPVEDHDHDHDHGKY